MIRARGVKTGLPHANEILPHDVGLGKLDAIGVRRERPVRYALDAKLSRRRVKSICRE